MAEPTPDEKVAAAQTALADLGVTDPDEARRAVAAFWSQVPLLPVPERQEPPAAESPVLVTAMLNSEDPAMKARIKALGEEAQAIMTALMTAPS